MARVNVLPHPLPATRAPVLSLQRGATYGRGVSLTFLGDLNKYVVDDAVRNDYTANFLIIF